MSKHNCHSYSIDILKELLARLKSSEALASALPSSLGAGERNGLLVAIRATEELIQREEDHFSEWLCEYNSAMQQEERF